ncbi:putative membrane protein [Candidatus Kuenenia stuttgartiensis]|nr:MULTISPECIES: tellurite resistance/C4-dicarboxylate transporter family protein [Kuenenia]MBE7548830.1 tellurite resistance/C4-dicarboxylate transporter family protein [Planctomycetia bacterium]MBZ0190765.1 tellurite resistance/C4-dicarboxylate transporter family protein [Candidatus Kuenenia stuttgartiensis]MCL4728112.1 tellurite resistance/C4-dicarboxylate transporter family protein [Candidatus Kuenenia stuttgartiensis]MCZ7622338.1 tellurite resistance/C4-dicarboxylate transporter family pro
MIKTLHPAYFVFIMSTGIISIASNMLGITPVAQGLFYLNIVAYAVILTIQILRIIMYWSLLYSDISNPKLGLVYFAIVAGTNVLGAQFVTVVNCQCVAKSLWFFGIFLWVVLTLSTFTLLFLKNEQQIERTIHGGWLVSVVGTQSVAVLGALLSPCFAETSNFILFSSMVWWMIGCFLYVVIITLITYRLIFFKIAPEVLVPPYWINTGAVAITTLAGATISLSIPKIEDPFLDIDGFIKGFSVFFWSFGTWWIPLLVIIGIWKYVYHMTPYKYNPLYWGLAFPLGTYTAGTLKLAEALGIGYISNISKVFIYIAYIAWLIVFVTMIRSFLKPALAKQ